MAPLGTTESPRCRHHQQCKPSTIMNTPTILAFGPLGTPELIIIAILILVLFGAKKLPTFARSLGKSMGEFKKARTEFENELHNAQEEAEPRRSTRRRKSASQWPAWRIPKRLKRHDPFAFHHAAGLRTRRFLCHGGPACRRRAGAPHVLLLQSQELAHDGPVRPARPTRRCRPPPSPRMNACAW
jgi:sec-independent protein translocase protein TatA